MGGLIESRAGEFVAASADPALVKVGDSG